MHEHSVKLLCDITRETCNFLVAFSLELFEERVLKLEGILLGFPKEKWINFLFHYKVD